MEYTYDISMKWYNKDKSNKDESFDIPAININSLGIINDYEETIMPILYATITIEKKNFDKIIKNAKTAFIDLKISKISEDDGTKVDTPYSGKMSYFIDTDLNYNKELDYPETNKDQTTKSDSKGVLQTYSLGLMYTECIEMNKQTSNTTIRDSTMINSVGSFLQGVPLLIEPFNYNEKIDQLIVPPKDSLMKTVEYFNKIKVFYDTSYRFYIEPKCVYLISSSGKPVAKKGEKYDTCLFNIRSITDPASARPGMIEDNTNKCYYIDIHVKDSYYTKDNDTQKRFNSLDAIIDPSKYNIKPMLDSVNDAIKNINKLTNTITGAVKSTIKDIQKMPSDITDFKCDMSLSVSMLNLIIKGRENKEYFSTNNEGIGRNNYTIATIDKAISIIGELSDINKYYNEIPPASEGGEPTRTYIITLEEINLMQANLRTAKNNINNCNNNLQNSLNQFKDITVSFNDILCQTTNLPGVVNCVDATCMGKNANELNKRTDRLKEKANQNRDNIQTVITEKISKSQQILSSMHDALSVIYQAYDVCEGSYYNGSIMHGDGKDTDEFGNEGESVSYVANPFYSLSQDLSTDIDKAEAYIGTDENSRGKTITEVNGTFGHEESDGSWSIDLDDEGNPITIDQKQTTAIPIIGIMGQYKEFTNIANKSIDKIQPYAKTIDQRVKNIGSLYKDTWLSIENIGTEAKKSLDRIVSSAKTIENKIKSLDFNINSLPDLQKDINAVKDITHIGMLGISSFGVDLNLGTSSDTSTGKKIVRVSNDNANMLKNIKSKIATYSNLLSITKTGLDTTVFTINKRYVIKNYDAHSNIDGVFILIKKQDFFMRAGDKFTISTQLDLAKVSDSTGDDGKKQKVDMDSEVSRLLRSASNITDIAKHGITLNNLGSIISNASTIQESYKKLSKTSPNIKNIDIDKFKMS